jgi:predicted amidophosphoribosyltransferase
MHCPTCGAEIQKADQRYCHECGASLPQASLLPTTKVRVSPSQVIDTPILGKSRPAAHELLAGVLPNTFQNRLIVGGVTAVVAIFAVWMLVNWIVSTLIHLVLPAAVLVAVVYVGFRYLRSRPST